MIIYCDDSKNIKVNMKLIKHIIVIILLLSIHTVIKAQLMFEEINCEDYWNTAHLGSSIKLYFEIQQLLTTASEITK